MIVTLLGMVVVLHPCISKLSAVLISALQLSRECILANVCHTAWDGDGFECLATYERRIRNSIHITFPVTVTGVVASVHVPQLTVPYLLNAFWNLLLKSFVAV